MSYRAPSASMESLENRRLMAVTVDTIGSVRFVIDAGNVVRFQTISDIINVTSKGTLVVKGTSAGDSIAVSRAGSQFQVELNGTTFILASEKVRAKRVLVEADGGDDRVYIDPTMNAPVTVVGGSGDDIIDGGPGDTLIGGSGNDRLNLPASTVISFNIGDSAATGRVAELTGTYNLATLGTYTVFGTSAPGLASGGAGNDTIVANGSDSVVGGQGDDKVFVSGSINVGDLEARAEKAKELLEDRVSGVEEFDLLMGLRTWVRDT